MRIPFLGNRRPDPEPSETRTERTFQEIIGSDIDEFYRGGSLTSIPAFWAAIDFISSTMATLPIHIYRQDNQQEPVNTPLSRLISESPYPGTTSQEWREALFCDVLSEGRSIAYIERHPTTRVPTRIHWQLDPTAFTFERQSDGSVLYKYKEGTGGTKTWGALDVIEVVWKHKRNKLDHVKPKVEHRETIETALALRAYEKRFADSFGMPLFAVEHDASIFGKMGIPELTKIITRLLTAIRLARKNKDGVVPLESGQRIVPLATSPEQSKIQVSQQYTVRDVCRIYSLAPLYLHDLDRQTYSNSEIQAQSAQKFTFSSWATKLEKQIDYKLLQRSRGPNMISRHDFGEFLRGDLAARITAFAQAIQSGQMTPNEARAAEDRPPREGGDKLMIQGATIPITDQNPNNSNGQQDPDEDDPDET